MNEKFEKSIETIDQTKRDTIRKLVRTAAFTAPVVATFAIDGNLNKALSGVSTSSNS